MNIEQVHDLDYYNDKLLIRRELKSRGITFDYSHLCRRQGGESTFIVMFYDGPHGTSSAQIDAENWHSASDVRAIGCKARLVKAIEQEQS